MSRALPFIIGLAAGISLAASLSTTAQKPFPDQHAPARPAAWLGKPDLALHVRWVRVDEIPQAEVRDGVCVIYMPDRDEASLLAAEDLLAKCAAGPISLQSPAPAGTVLLYWYRVESAEAIGRMRAELYPYATPQVLAGYYHHPDPAGPCHVITNVNRRAVGHEIKHCFDGEFHTSRPGPLGGREHFWRTRS